MPNQFEKPILKYKKEFSFKYDETTVNTFISLTYDNKKICDQNTKEWQKTFGTYAKDRANSHDAIDFSIFSTDYPCKFIVERLAKRLMQEADDQVYDEEETINLLIAFVNFLPYELEPADKDYWKTPYETLIDGKGDCEDVSFLLAELISLAGFDSILAHYEGHMGVCANPGDNVNSTGLDGWNVGGKDYYFCEPTPNNAAQEKCWTLGKYPEFVRKLGKPTSTRLVPANVLANSVTTYQTKERTKE